MTKNGIIVTIIVLVALMISIAISLDPTKIKKLVASQVENLNTTSATVLHVQNPLTQLEASVLEQRSQRLDLPTLTLRVEGKLLEL